MEQSGTRSRIFCVSRYFETTTVEVTSKLSPFTKNCQLDRWPAFWSFKGKPITDLKINSLCICFFFFHSLIILKLRGLIFSLTHVSRTQYSFFIHLCPEERNTISQFDVDIEDYCSEGAGHQVGKYKNTISLKSAWLQFSILFSQRFVEWGEDSRQPQQHQQHK